MKYIRSINELNELIESEINELINWDLINDTKDMSLEYIDEGYTLYILIYKGFSYKYELIAEISYNHDINSIEYDNLPSNNNKLIYNIYIGKHRTSSYPKYTFELRDRIKEAYPNESIMR